MLTRGLCRLALLGSVITNDSGSWVRLPTLRTRCATCSSVGILDLDSLKAL